MRILFHKTLSLVLLWGGLCLLLAMCTLARPLHPDVLLRPTALVSLAPLGWQAPTPTATPQPAEATPSPATPRAVAGWGKVHQLAWTDENELFLWADSGLLTYDTETLVLRRMYPWPFDVAELAFSPAGDQVVFMGHRYNWRSGIWWIEARTGNLERILPTDCSGRMVFAPDGKVLAVACASTELWSVNETLSLVRIRGRWNDVLAFSPDGRWLAAGGWHEIRLWERATQRLDATWPLTFNEPLTALTFSPDSATLAALSRSGDLWLWDVAQQALRGTAYVRGYQPGMCYSPDGAVLVTWRERIDLRDPQTGALQDSLTIPRGLVDYVAFSPDGKTLAVLSGGEITFWDVGTLERHPHGLRDHVSLVYQVVCSPDGQRLLTIDDYDLVQVRDPVTLHVMGEWRGDWDRIYAADPTVTYLAGWDWYREEVLSVQYAVDGRVVFTATVPSLTAMAFDRTERLATADSAGRVQLWNVTTGESSALSKPKGQVTHLAFAPDGRWLALSDDAGRIDVYTTHPDRAYTSLRNPPFVTATLNVPLTQTLTLNFSPDGATLAALFALPEIRLAVVRLWDVETGALRREWSVPDRNVRALVWNLDGSRLAVSTSRGVYVWDPRDGREIVRLPRGGEDGSGQMAFCASDDWQMLAVSHGNWVGLWDVP